MSTPAINPAIELRNVTEWSPLLRASAPQQPADSRVTSQFQRIVSTPGEKAAAVMANAMLVGSIVVLVGAGTGAVALLPLTVIAVSILAIGVLTASIVYRNSNKLEQQQLFQKYTDFSKRPMEKTDYKEKWNALAADCKAANVTLYGIQETHTYCRVGNLKTFIQHFDKHFPELQGHNDSFKVSLALSAQASTGIFPSFMYAKLNHAYGIGSARQWIPIITPNPIKVTFPLADDPKSNTNTSITGSFSLTNWWIKQQSTQQG